MLRIWISRVRTVAAWLIPVAYLSLIIANKYLMDNYPRMGYFGPHAPESVLMWRNGSLIAVAVCIIVAIPRWQSLAGIIALIIFFFLFAGA